MELGRVMQIMGVVFCVLLVVTEIYSLPPYSSEDYDQGVRDMMEELERQGLTGPMVARAYHPNHNMMRKSQRSNNLRLRFGKRSVQPFESPLNTRDLSFTGFKAQDDAQKTD